MTGCDVIRRRPRTPLPTLDVWVLGSCGEVQHPAHADITSFQILAKANPAIVGRYVKHVISKMEKLG